MDMDWGQLAALAGVLLAVGTVAGILAGLLGVGGGIVIVPALYHLLGPLGVEESARMHLAVGTSLATIIPTSIMSMRAHYRKGAVDVDLLKSWGPAIALGVVAGAALTAAVRGDALTAVFAVVALAVAAHMALSPEGLRLADALPAGPRRFGMGAAIGGFSTMMGIGGGTLSVPALTLCNYPIHRAVGTASAIGLIIAVPGTVGAMLGGWNETGLPPLTVGHVSLIGFALIVPATMLAAPWGARLAHAVDRRALRRAFALFLGLTSLRMFYGLIA